MIRTIGLIWCTLALATSSQQHQQSQDLITKAKSKHFQEVAETAVKENPVAEFPCPDPDLFAPCTCVADADFTMDADCSSAADDEELALAFTVTQSFLTYRSLTIQPTTRTDLNTFTKDTFGGVSFETVTINGTNLKVIQDGTFTDSEARLTTLNLHDNAIEDFPFEALPKFTSLHTLNLRNNVIGQVQNLESDSLVTLNFRNNPTLDISLGLFGRAPLLETLDLHNCNIDDLTTDMFLLLESVTVIDLSSNQITQLRENAINAPNPTLESLDLSDNPLYDMSISAIRASQLVADAAELLFVNNEFVELCESTWGELVNHLNTGNIKLAGNPLRCGCDMAWLFDSRNLNTKLDATTSCSDDSIVQELVPEVFADHCDPMPEGICPEIGELQAGEM